MKQNSETTTSLTLLGRLRDSPTDEAGWDEFVRRYGNVIEIWLRRWGLQEADAMDVTQTILLSLSKQMRTFEYNPSGRFRNWLQTVAYRAWCDFLRSHRKRLDLIGDEEVMDGLTSQNAQDEFLQTLQDECTRELLELAAKRVKPKVKETTWQAFELLTWQNVSADEVADRLQMTKGAVLVARGRVRKLLTTAMKELESDESSAAESK